MSPQAFDRALFGAAGEAPVVSETTPPSETTPSLEDIYNEEINHQAVQETLRAGLSPAGTYRTNPEKYGEATATRSDMFDKDDAGNDIPGTGRRIITIRGRMEAFFKDKTQPTGQRFVATAIGDPRSGLQLSPDVREKNEYDPETNEIIGTLPGTRDSKSARWAEACLAFKAQFGDEPKTLGAVVDFLKFYSYRVNLRQMGVPTKNNPNPSMEPRNYVGGIYADKRGR